MADKILEQRPATALRNEAEKRLAQGFNCLIIYTFSSHKSTGHRICLKIIQLYSVRIHERWVMLF